MREGFVSRRTPHWGFSSLAFGVVRGSLLVLLALAPAWLKAADPGARLAPDDPSPRAAGTATVQKSSVDGLSPAQRARRDIRERKHTGTTRGLALGYVQCNLVVLPQPLAYDFLLYCQRNQRSCPVLEVTDVGSWEPKLSAPGADLRTDLPRYAVYRHGRRVADETNLLHLWQTNFVAFLIGSGITFDAALEEAGVPTDKYRWVLRSTLPTVPAGRFHGPMVVTMRWLTPAQARIATEVTAHFPFHHGAPIHQGDPSQIGADLQHPLFGPPVDAMPPELVPVFWACGVTPQAAAEAAEVELMITHAPAHGFITDLKAEQFRVP